MKTLRERVFELFRQWGYLEAELDPLGLLPPASSDLQIDNEWAPEARRIYRHGGRRVHAHRGSGRRHWIRERLEGELERGTGTARLLMQADLFEQTYNNVISATSVSRSKELLLCCRCWMKCSTSLESMARWNSSWG
jgi:hypothetical protein